MLHGRLDGPDTPRLLVCDSNDMRTSFSAYAERIAVYWQQWLRGVAADAWGGWIQRTERPSLTCCGETSISDLRCRLNWDLVETELLRLTEQQYRTVEGLSLNDRAIVTGGAGTGKTLLAVNEARREAGTGKRVLLTCFNRRLADLMAAVLQACGRRRGASFARPHGRL